MYECGPVWMVGGREVRRRGRGQVQTSAVNALSAQGRDGTFPGQCFPQAGSTFPRQAVHSPSRQYTHQAGIGGRS
jgi:hypothetical protein